MNSKLVLKKNEEGRIKSGHLWVFSNEIDKIDGEINNGDIVELYDWKKNLLGTGFYNKNSLIALRLLSFSKVEDISTLLKEKILSALYLRKRFYPDRESFRMVFSESDFLPGLIIDKYNNTYVLQIYSFGMQKIIGHIIDILRTDFAAKNIFTKNENYLRKLEGLQEADEVYYGAMEKELIDDGKIKYGIDFLTGQKTGFYFDQSDNRFFIECIVKNNSVLDAFCNSGGFGLHAAAGGAHTIKFLDSSENEIAAAQSNFQLNKFNNTVEFINDDVFDYLKKQIESGVQYDVVMIDPPAFAKNKKSLPSAIKGYEKLNRLAILNIRKDGFLVTSSCSYHVKKENFIKIINSSAVKEGRKIQMLYFNGASFDHPQLPAMEETSYLKFGVFRIL
jgi:23S rRNA (cytosine1962-C5)-methyltransferase